MNELSVEQTCQCGSKIILAGKHTYVDTMMKRWLEDHRGHGGVEQHVVNHAIIAGRDQMKTRILNVLFDHIKTTGLEELSVLPDSLVVGIEIIKNLGINDDHIVPDDSVVVQMREQERAAELQARIEESDNVGTN